MMQCKDIPDGPILEVIASCTRSIGANNDEVLAAMPAGTPPKLAIAKMRQLVARKIIYGCACGCRGDYTIPEKGVKP